MENNKDNKSLVLERLRKAISDSGLPASRVAEIAGIATVSLYRILNGDRNLGNLETLNKLSNALKTPIAYLIGEIDEFEQGQDIKLSFTPKPPKKLSYGELLRNLLDAKGLTQTEAAELIKMDRKIFNNYVRGKREPNMQMWQRISTALSVPVGYFFNEITLEDALKHNEPTPERLEKLNKLHGLLRDLDDSELEKIIEATEKEKVYKDYTKMIHSKKTS
ncbi:hypothetical protein ADMFC3_00470 [Geovibrio sp. ADMFC3]